MKLILALTAAAMLTAPSLAAPACRDTKGHFAKCPGTGAALGTAAASGNISKDQNGKCHIITPAPGQRKGQFAPCPK